MFLDGGCPVLVALALCCLEGDGVKFRLMLWCLRSLSRTGDLIALLGDKDAGVGIDPVSASHSLFSPLVSRCDQRHSAMVVNWSREDNEMQVCSVGYGRWILHVHFLRV